MQRKRVNPFRMISLQAAITQALLRVVTARGEDFADTPTETSTREATGIALKTINKKLAAQGDATMNRRSATPLIPRAWEDAQAIHRRRRHAVAS